MPNAHSFPFQRINIIGTSGSGKTTFSRELARILEIPHFEMDAMYWGPDWSAASDEELLSTLTAALRSESWVVDGNYVRTTSVKWANVDCVIWLDLPFVQTVFRVLKRAIGRSMTQEELWEGTGNRESLRTTFFSRKSVVLWAVRTHAKNKANFVELMQDARYAHIKFIRLRSSKAADDFLNQLQASA